MDVIKRLNKFRLERKMSVYRLAELTGINQSTLANTFSRGIVPSVQNLILICEALGITPAQFFAEDETRVYLTSEEVKLFENYKKLPRDIQESVNHIVNSVAKATKD